MAYRPKYAQSSAEGVREHRKTEKWGSAVAVLCVVLTAFLVSGIFAAIAMDNELINTVSYGCQREISDIIYFATALPEQR